MNTKKDNNRITPFISFLGMALILCIHAVPCRAELYPGLQIHGFLTQGITSTSDNDFFRDSDDTLSFHFTEIGVNASWSVRSDLQLAAQILSRRAGRGSDGAPDLDYGLLDYSPISDLNRRYGVRLGRIKHPLGLYNDTRDVAFTRPGILLPQSIYFDRLRDLLLSSDGVQVYGERITPLGSFTAQLQLGYPQVDKAIEYSFFGFDAPGKMDGNPVFFGRLLYDDPSGRWRLGFTHSGARFDYEATGNDFVSDGFVYLRQYILSAQMHTDDWTFSAEYLRQPTRFRDLGPFLPQRTFPLESYYIQGVYRFAPRWDLVLRYDAIFLDRNDQDGSETTSGPEASSFARDWTIGLGWQPKPNLLFRTEMHMVDGTAWLPAQDNAAPQDQERRWKLFMFQISYRF
ncbi:MAG: hypothetical protein KDH88_13605 [Chromatiales bacterium]|nr:hypothetical protein [Chromatiales bacterium]